MATQIIDRRTTGIIGATGDVTPEALQALADAKAQADRSTTEANRAETMAGNAEDYRDEAENLVSGAHAFQDASVASYVDGSGDTAQALQAAFMSSPAAAGRIRAALESRHTSPMHVVFLGSSTTAGNGASGKGFQYVDRVLAGLQARFPSGTATETDMQPISSAPYSRPGVHGYNGGVGGYTTPNMLNDGQLAGISQIQPDVIVITCGSNDWRWGHTANGYRNNMLTKMNEIRAVLNRPAVFVLVHQWTRIDPNEAVDQWANFGKSLLSIAKESPDEVAFVNADIAFTAADFQGDDPYALRRADGVHGTDRAHAMLADEVLRVIAPSATATSPNSLIGYADLRRYNGPIRQPLIGSGLWEFSAGSEGDWVTDSGGSYSTGRYNAAFDVGAEQVRATVEMRRPGSASSGIGIGFKDPNNRIYFYYSTTANGGAGGFLLAVTIAGSNVVVADANIPFSAGQWKSIGLYRSGDRVYGLVDGEEVCDHLLSGAEKAAVEGATKVYIRQGAPGEAGGLFRELRIVSQGSGGVAHRDPSATGIVPLQVDAALTGTASYMVSKDFVHVTYDVTGTISGDIRIAGPMPEDHFPRALAVGSALSQPLTAAATYVASTSGDIRASCASGTTRLRGAITYPR